jgi:uncharacterized protein with GYD domain
MPTYIVLGHFTDQGIRAVRDSIKREDALSKQCDKVGAQVKDVYRTMGRYDLVATIEAPNDVTVAHCYTPSDHSATSVPRPCARSHARRPRKSSRS